jgi:ribonuclease VapC
MEYLERIARGGGGLLSAGTLVELGAVTSKEDTVHSALLEFLGFPFIEIEPVDAEQALVAVDAYRRFGRGRHPARLNFGDTFAYALARQKDLPLLFKGDDFSLTDVRPALPA